MAKPVSRASNRSAPTWLRPLEVWNFRVVPAATATTLVVGAVKAAAVGTANDVVAGKVGAAPMALPLIRCAPRTKAVVCSAGRPGTAVNGAMNGHAAVAR